MTGFLIALLLSAAVLHLVWAMGINWPIRDEAGLAKAVVGTKGISKMPPRWASALVVFALSCAAFFVAALVGAFVTPIPDVLIRTAAWLLVAVFTLRGLASYLPVWRRQMEPEFDRLNTRFYGPLCLLMGTLTVLHLL